MAYGYFPGCSLHSTARDYHLSLESVCEEMQIDLTEVSKWNCCGATPAHTTNQELGIALPYNNLLSAESDGLDTILAPCAACYNRLKCSQHEVNTNEAIRNRMARILGGTLKKDIEVLNILEFLRDRAGLDNLKSRVVRPLKNIKAAPYYGCLLVRPHDVLKFDDPESPQSMDEILMALGAGIAPWNRKTECCGGSMAIPETDIVLELGRTIFNAAHIAEADCIVVACPLCQSNLDMRQRQINRKFNTSYNIPVLYITQMIGLALGIETTRLGLDMLFTYPDKLLKAFLSESQN